MPLYAPPRQLTGDVAMPYRLRAAVGPRLRVLLRCGFVLFGLLLANSLYLLAITTIEAATEKPLQSFFYQSMFLAHLLLGLLLLPPLVLFGGFHIAAARRLPNFRARRIGYALFATALVLMFSGLALMRVAQFDLKQPVARQTVYLIHVLTPCVVVWLYWLHRLAGPPIRWRIAIRYLAAISVFLAVMLAIHGYGRWERDKPFSTTSDDERPFYPSLVTTPGGQTIPDQALMKDYYCLQCHKDVHERWSHSAHRFSSFNNPVYLASIRETRRKLLKRDGNVQAARFCAACHDPVPLLSGAFDDPDFDDVNDPAAHAGITCTVCHAVTHINSNRGNADFTIAPPPHYPFAFSKYPALAWVSRQLIKARPQMHKRTFLKPLHKTAEFCGTCHHVRIPEQLNHYRSLPGQNHYGSFVLSGVSGGGARSFYYPDLAEPNCNNCHMPPRPSNDFGARAFGDDDTLKVHDHLFLGANTALPYLRGETEIVHQHQAFLARSAEVDIFGLRENARIDGEQHAPIRPNLPHLSPGRSYLLEIVIRTRNIGHTLTQGTADSNQLWLDVTASSAGRVIGRSGVIDQDGKVDPWAHFLNVFMLDRNGKRINRRNVQDIFVPLYNHQIPPGAADTVLYRLDVPPDVRAPIEVRVQLRYRKFDRRLMRIVANRIGWTGKLSNPDTGDTPLWRNLPITTLADDRVILPLAGMDENAVSRLNNIRATPLWRRWNDYGIGLFLKGTAALRQAEQAFDQVEAMGRYDGPLNLARLYFREGRLNEAGAAANRAAMREQSPAPRWVFAWLTGLVNHQQGYLSEAEAGFRSVLAGDSVQQRDRGFHFYRDTVVLNALGNVLFEQGRLYRDAQDDDKAKSYLRNAADAFEATLRVDPQNIDAHYNLRLIYDRLGLTKRAAEHARLHKRYKHDDNARDRAIAAARRRYPAANHAAEALVIYPLQRPGAPGVNKPKSVRKGSIEHTKE